MTRRGRPLRIGLAGLLLAACATEQPATVQEPPVATFSIVAFDPDTQELGIAVQSKFLGVGAVVPWAKAGVGAIATQSYANTSYGPRGLEMLASGVRWLLAPAKRGTPNLHGFNDVWTTPFPPYDAASDPCASVRPASIRTYRDLVDAFYAETDPTAPGVKVCLADGWPE